MLKGEAQELRSDHAPVGFPLGALIKVAIAADKQRPVCSSRRLEGGDASRRHVLYDPYIRSMSGSVTTKHPLPPEESRECRAIKAVQHVLFRDPAFARDRHAPAGQIELLRAVSVRVDAHHAPKVGRPAQLAPVEV